MHWVYFSYLPLSRLQKWRMSLECMETSEMYCSLKNLSCCSATFCNFFWVKPLSRKNLHMDDGLISSIRVVSSCFWTYMPQSSTTRLRIKSWAGTVSFLNAFSLGYGCLETLPDWKNNCTVLWTVDLSKPRFAAIWLYVHPNASHCSTILHCKSSL